MKEEKWARVGRNANVCAFRSTHEMAPQEDIKKTHALLDDPKEPSSEKMLVAVMTLRHTFTDMEMPPTKLIRVAIRIFMHAAIAIAFVEVLTIQRCSALAVHTYRRPTLTKT